MSVEIQALLDKYIRNALNQQIDKLVYEMYGLTQDEIKALEEER